MHAPLESLLQRHPFFASGRLAFPHSRFARAGEGIRTLDINLGKVALYQLSYARDLGKSSSPSRDESTLFPGADLHPRPHPVGRSFVNPHPGSSRLLEGFLHRLSGELRPVAVLADVAKKKIP